MLLETSHLELLAALANTTSLASASRDINLSPSAASRRLQDAEQLLGIALTSKSGRTLHLTAAGRVLAEAAAMTATQLAEAELAARWLSMSAKQPVRVGVGFHDSISWLLPRYVELPYEVVRAADNDLMIVVIGGEPEGKDHVLAADELVLAVSVDHPLAAAETISVAQIIDQTYLAGSIDPIPGFEFDRYFLPSGDCPTDIVSIQSFSLLMELVAKNEGVTIQPARTVAGRTEQGVVLVRLDRTIPVSWVARHGRESSPRVERFLELMTEMLG